MMTSWEGDHQIFLDLIMERDVEKALKEIKAHVERGLTRVSKYFVGDESKQK